MAGITTYLSVLTLNVKGLDAPPIKRHHLPNWIKKEDQTISCLQETHLIDRIKGATHQKEITVFNLYSPNVSAPNFIKHTLRDLKVLIDTNTVVVGYFNTPI
jgi:hypothetical protein